MSSNQLATVADGLMENYEPRVHLEIVAGMIHQAGLTITQVARRIGKKPATLAREINPDDDGAKLSATDEVLITAICGLFDSRDYAEGHLGRCAFQLPRAEGAPGEIVEATAQAMVEFGEFLSTSAASMSPGSEGGAEVTPEEAEQVLAELRDVEQKFAQLRALFTGLAIPGRSTGRARKP